LERSYFLILDTGHDCLTAESFWDNGAKKLGPLSVDDNIIGGSPDTMAFYPPNEHYPYSQIAWMEQVLTCINSRHPQSAGTSRPCRIFVGVHTPPANISKKARVTADERSNKGPFMVTHDIDIRYGTINHYLSQFYYLCLGYREGELAKPPGPVVDAIFAGHAHWSIEFKLCKPEAQSDGWNPEVWYGRFSEKVERSDGDPAAWWGPLLLQTGACGPPSDTDPKTPNFRYVTVGPDLGVHHLRPRNLTQERPWLTMAAGTSS